jgi:hypothetical protein
MVLEQDITKAKFQICSRCIYDERVASISFDENGVCNYCRQTDDLKSLYGTGQAVGEEKLRHIVDKIKGDGKDKTYDV